MNSASAVHASSTRLPQPSSKPPKPATIRRPDDSALGQAIARALCTKGFRHLWNVTVSVRNGVAWLRGEAPNFYLKQVAQETARAIQGVKIVINEINVMRREANP